MKFYASILEDRSCVVVGRLIDKTETLYTQVNISSVTYRVVRLDTDAEVVASTALDKTVVVFDTPFAWSKSIKTANFRHVIGVGVFTVGGISYEVQYTITGTDGTVGGAAVVVDVEDMVGV